MRRVFNPPPIISNGQGVVTEGNKYQILENDQTGTVEAPQEPQVTKEQLVDNTLRALSDCPISQEALYGLGKSATMKRYSVGFMFAEDELSILLIQKTKPEEQRNKLNGIGGHVEEGEDYLDCMVREFEEECGIKTSRNQWRNVVIKRGPGYELYCFAAKGPILSYKITTDEIPVVISVDQLHHWRLYESVDWMIPLCLDKRILFPVEVRVEPSK